MKTLRKIPGCCVLDWAIFNSSNCKRVTKNKKNGITVSVPDFERNYGILQVRLRKLEVAISFPMSTVLVTLEKITSTDNQFAVCKSDSAYTTKVPKCSPEPKVVEKLLHSRLIWTLSIIFESACIPPLSKFPTFLNWHNISGC
jgi:hypothetical protein